MSNEGWQRSRLIPTSGISGSDEAERRATSALLAVMSSVREFGVALTKPLGAPAAALETFVEVPFKHGSKTLRPDGLIRASRGNKQWTALVEVKTGTGTLETTQLEAYLDIARENGFDAVLTISNELAIVAGRHPTKVDGRKTKSVALHHLAWSEVVAEAVKQRVHRGVADPDQAWILGELIRYLKHPKSGAQRFGDMGEYWTSILDAVSSGSLRHNNVGLSDVAENWERTLSTVAIHMSQELGVDVTVVRSRKELDDPQSRITGTMKNLVDSSRLNGKLRIAGAIGDLEMSADLRGGRLAVSVSVEAPQEGRQTTRVNWLTRQLRDAPDDLVLDAFTHGAKTSLSDKLGAVRANPDLLVEDQKKDVRRMAVTQNTSLGTGRRGGKKAFVDGVVEATWGFYGDVVQQLQAWVPKAPQRPSGGRQAAETVGLDLTPDNSDEPERSEQVQAPQMPSWTPWMND